MYLGVGFSIRFLNGTVIDLARARPRIVGALERLWEAGPLGEEVAPPAGAPIKS